jgi:hypothetical protein
VEWEPPEGSAVRDSARELDPWAIAPKAGLALALGGALALGWAIVAPMLAGEPVPPHLERFHFPNRGTPFGGLLAIMMLGAVKRCFGFGWPTAVGLVVGIGLPLGLAGVVPPPALAGSAALLALLGVVVRAPIGRFRLWAAAAVGSLGLALVTIAAVGWTLDPSPRDPLWALRPIAAGWTAGAFGLVGGGLIGVTSRRERG